MVMMTRNKEIPICNYNFAKKQTTIIAVCNQKGGVGKTVTSVNLAFGLAKNKKTVLLADLDAQGSATTCFGFQPDELQITLSDIINNSINEIPFEPLDGILHHTEGVDLLPSNITLSTMEMPLTMAIGKETVLKDYLKQIQERYDYIILDCSPSLNIITINALTAANQVLIPVQAQHLSITGMEQLLVTISKVKKRINPELEIIGILPTMVNERTSSQKQILELLHETYDGKIPIFKTAIPQSIQAAEFSINGTSIYEYNPKGKVAIAYQNLVNTILSTEIAEGETPHEQVE